MIETTFAWNQQLEQFGRYGRVVARVEAEGGDLGAIISATGVRGTTGSTPGTRPNTPACKDKPETPTAGCGPAPIQSCPGRGETTAQGPRKLQ
jgi:hypothetical protein